MNQEKRTLPGRDDRADWQKLYALLCGVKTSVDRLALQVKQLRKEREAAADE